jgi:hypothetical protein
VFWLIYITSSIFFSLIVRKILTGTKKNLVVFVILIILLTPAQIEVGSSDYAPAVLTFLFNSLLEQNYSMRVLRPILLSLPISLTFLTLVMIAKRRFS